MSPTNHHRKALATVGVVSLALATGCGSTDDASSLTTVSDNSSIPSASTTITTTGATAPSTAPTTTTAATTPSATTDPTTTTTTGPGSASIGDLQLPIPTGTFEIGPADVFVLSRSGDLELWSGALTASAEQRTLVADYPDPFDVVTEGPGPNVIDDVAGGVGGTVIFGDCCEPISGNVLAATGPGDVARIAGGYSPTLSPTGDLLGTANDNVISQTAADPMGTGTYRQLNQQPQRAFLHVTDLAWSSSGTGSADDDHMVLLAWDEDGWWLYDVDRSTLEATPAVRLGLPPIGDVPYSSMEFVGHGPGAEIVVAERAAATTRLRYFDPTTLTELPRLERSLPGSASSIRLGDDGLGLLWVDGGSLYHLPAGERAAVRLGTDALAAWFGWSTASSLVT